MRAKEFLSNFLNEGLMKYGGANNDWFKEKYALPFLDGLTDGQVYSFRIGDQNINGVIQNPEQVKRVFARALASKDENILKAVSFDVEEYNEDGAPTGQIYNQIKLNQIFKDEKIKGEITPNMGNVSEAILGCAVAARFANGGARVTEQQLVEMGRILAQNKGYVETSAGKDKLVFKVSIPFLDRKVFYAWLGEDSRGKTLKDYSVPEEKIKLIEQRAKAAVEYANTSKRVAGAIQEAQQDPGSNKVDVLSDGGEKENQSVTKVDLKILIDGKESAKRLLSVKAGRVAQFGQVTGVNFDHANEFFSSSVGVSLPESVKKYFHEIPHGKRGAEKEKEFNFNNGYAMAFQSAFKQLSARAKSDQSGLIEDVYQGLLHHLTRKEPGVEMVILDPDGKKAFRELSFGPEFEQALRQLQLVVTESGVKGYNISIYGFPVGSIAKKYVPSRKDADSKLVDLTSQYKDGSIRNMLGMGNLLKNLADIENHIEQAQQPQQPATQKPAQQMAPGVTQNKAVTAPTAPTAATTTPAVANQTRNLAVSKQKIGAEPK